MILHVDTPAGWTSAPIAEGIVHAKGDTTLSALRIRELPVDAARWMHRTALKGAPAGTQWTERSRAELVTRDGWSGLRLELDLVHGDWRRTRIVALYRFVDYAAGAIADVATSHYDPMRDELHTIFATGRPDWGPQDTTCLTRIFGPASAFFVTKS